MGGKVCRDDATMRVSKGKKKDDLNIRMWCPHRFCQHQSFSQSDSGYLVMLPYDLV